MKKRNIIFVVSLVVLFLVAGGAVLYGALSHNEPTFRGYGQWQSVPVNVSCRPYFQTENRCDFVESQISRFNRRVGGEIFRYVEDDYSRIEIVTGYPHDVGGSHRQGAAALEISSDGNIISCEILSKYVPDDEVFGHVIRHELGHCLDLDHDNFESSLMFPSTYHLPVPMGTFPPRLTDTDRDAIRERYGL